MAAISGWPQLANFSFQLFQPGTLGERQHRLITDVRGSPGVNPVPQGLSYQPILTRNIRDGPRLVYDLPDGCFAKFRRILPTFA